MILYQRIVGELYPIKSEGKFTSPRRVETLKQRSQNVTMK